jgi:ankyrin repeat protein
LGQQNYDFSILTKSKFFAQKIKKVNINSNININNDNIKIINENLDSENLRTRFLNDEKVIQYLQYNPYVSMRKIIRDNSTKCLKDNGIEDSYQFLKTLINEGETNKFEEYFSFVKEKFDINNKDEDGNTLLILCAKNGLIKLASLLIENGADVNKQNNKGNTALHYAISLKHFTLADLLAKHNAKEDVINKFGYTPWECIEKSIEEKFY